MFLELDREFGKKELPPEDYEAIWYIFWEKGVDLTSFNTLPLPYIFSVMKTHSYVLKKQEEHAKKRRK